MKKTKLWAIGYSIALTGFTVWLALDTFVIPHAYQPAAPSPIIAPAQAESTPAPVSTASGKQSGGKRNSKSRTQLQHHADSAPIQSDSADEAFPLRYDNGQTHIALSSYRVEDTTVYVADVTLSSPEALSSVLARDTYGRNVTETPSSMARRTSAVLAINGDYYGARERGYVVRNGTLYRSLPINGQEDLVIDANGNFSIIRENEVSAEALTQGGAVQVLSFGPALIESGEISVGPNDEVGRAMASNPRTALAQVGPLHYLFVVADGRTSASQGLSLHQLAQFLQSLGAETAYNLDGGGSSAMIFNGQLVNIPTTTGSRSNERSVSDIVAIF
ncbi:MAG: phosphodiester glycosidase family protein [Clostridia bacterium]|nr:phosphodiester glycosidase family protein [Clostridia bacterium]